jgi:hypothetical protein
MPVPIDRDELRRLRREEHAQLVEVLPAEESKTSTFRVRSTFR